MTEKHVAASIYEAAAGAITARLAAGMPADEIYCNVVATLLRSADPPRDALAFALAVNKALAPTAAPASGASRPPVAGAEHQHVRTNALNPNAIYGARRKAALAAPTDAPADPVARQTADASAVYARRRADLSGR